MSKQATDLKIIRTYEVLAGDPALVFAVDEEKNDLFTMIRTDHYVGPTSNRVIDVGQHTLTGLFAKPSGDGTFGEVWGTDKPSPKDPARQYYLLWIDPADPPEELKQLGVSLPQAEATPF